MRNFHVTYLLHALLPFLLFFEQLALTGDVPTVALGRYIFPDCLYSLPGNNLGPDRRLYGDIELLSGDQFFQLLTHPASERLCVVGMGECGKCIHRLSVEQDIELHQFRRPEIVDVVIERRIPFGDALQLIVKIDNDLSQRQVENNLHPVSRNVLLLDEDTPLAQAQGHDRADVCRACNDGRTDIRLVDMVDQCGIGQSGGVVHLLHVAFLVVHLVRNVGNGGDHVHIELALQPLLNDFHVQQSEKTAAETESQGHRRFGLESERSIIQLQLFQRCPQVFKLLAFDGVNTGKNHWLHLFEAGDGFVAGVLHVRDGVSHLYLFRRFDSRDDVSHVTALNPLAGIHAKA